MKKFMRKYLLMVLFCVGVLFGFGGMTKAAEWTDVTGILSGTSVKSLIVASDGVIYAGGYDSNIAKVWQYSSGAWNDFTGTLSGSRVNSLIQSSDGSIVAGGYGGANAAVWKYSSGFWNDITYGPLYDGYFINSLIQSSDGSIYAVGSGNSAQIWKYSSGSWDDVTGSLNVNSINAIIQASDGSIYVGGVYMNSARVWRYSSGIWIDTGIITTDNSEVNAIIQASDGSIYAGGYVGAEYSNATAKVWRYSLGSWTDATGSLSGFSIETLLQASDGSIYAGLNNLAKVWRYSSGSWTDITGVLSGNIVDTLIQASDGSIYAAGNSAGTAKVWQLSNAKQQEEQQQNNLELGNRITLESALNQQTISGQNLVINFTKLPTKLTKNNAYWMQWNKLSKYPNKTFLSNWKLKTNLNKYKVKKSSQKYKIKVTFTYTKKALKKYLKKNKSATSSNLYLKYKKKGGSWQNLSSAFPDAKVTKKGRKFIVKYFTKYPTKTQYFAIGVR